MAWRCSGRTNTELITNLYNAGIIESSRVRDAFLSVDRAHYCPSLDGAYQDAPQSIGYEATISAPHMHASAVESLLPYISDVTAGGGDGSGSGDGNGGGRGFRVLDVGSGSGYLTHVLANLVCGQSAGGAEGGIVGSDVATNAGMRDSARGVVIGVDHIPELTALATRNMSKNEAGRQLLETGQVRFITGDGRKGYEAGALDEKTGDMVGYDAIHVGAAAVKVHDELVRQLRSPGRMFIPVEDESRSDGDDWFGGKQQWIWVIDKDREGKVSRRRDMGVRYVMLKDAPVR